jgi:flagellar motility protein MotE (MotC chaperone)
LTEIQERAKQFREKEGKQKLTIDRIDERLDEFEKEAKDLLKDSYNTMNEKEIAKKLT